MPCGAANPALPAPGSCPVSRSVRRSAPSSAERTLRPEGVVAKAARGADQEVPQLAGLRLHHQIRRPDLPGPDRRTTRRPEGHPHGAWPRSSTQPVRSRRGLSRLAPRPLFTRRAPPRSASRARPRPFSPSTGADSACHPSKPRIVPQKAPSNPLRQANPPNRNHQPGPGRSLPRTAVHRMAQGEASPHGGAEPLQATGGVSLGCSIATLVSETLVHSLESSTPLSALS